MYIDWFVLVLVVLGFALVLRDNTVHADRRIDELMIKVHQLEYQVPPELNGIDTTLANRVRELEREVFPQLHNDIDYSKLNYIYARLWDLEDRVEAAARRLTPSAVLADDDSNLDDQLCTFRSAVMGAGYALGKQKDWADEL